MHQSIHGLATSPMLCTHGARGDLLKRVLVQYVGDETVAAQFPHGNYKSKSRNYVRTQPHVLQNIANSTGSLQHVYQQIVTENAGCSSGMQLSAASRNMRQVWHASFLVAPLAHCCEEAQLK